MNTEEKLASGQNRGDEDVNKILNLAMKAGRILLENGAEISRVEETMQRIAAAYGVTHDNFFVLANGIFTTGWDKDGKWPGSFAKVQHIPIRGCRLDRITEVNQLSREVASGMYTLEETEARLNAIRVSPGKPLWAQILGALIGSGGFSIIFGGSLFDALVSSVAGILVWLFVLLVSSSHFSKITTNILGSALGAVFCILMKKLGAGDNLGQMIIGAIVPLIPGVAFTNGIRDIAEADYLSGIVRLLDSLLGFLCIGVGVGIILILYTRFFGGTAL